MIFFFWGGDTVTTNNNVTRTPKMLKLWLETSHYHQWGMQALHKSKIATICTKYVHFRNIWNDWGAEQDQLPCGSTGTSSGNCPETETCMVLACHTSWQPLQNHPSGHTGGWTMLWSAEEMLDGQHQRVNIPAHARAAHKGLLQKSLEEDLCWIVPRVPPTTQSVRRLNWTEL